MGPSNPGVSMPSVREMAEEIVTREGGFVNDPDDPGGATKHGVTIHTMRRLGLDLTHDGRVDVADVKILTRAQAVEIFITHYFTRPRIHMLPDVLHDTVFDMYVNAGSNAVRVLQEMLAGIGHDIAVDGVIGPQTARVAHAAEAALGSQGLFDAYGVERREYYFRVADRRPASRKYALTRAGGKGGWIRRAEEFMSPRFHMTDAEFQARTAAWRS